MNFNIKNTIIFKIFYITALVILFVSTLALGSLYHLKREAALISDIDNVQEIEKLTNEITKLNNELKINKADLTIAQSKISELETENELLMSKISITLSSNDEEKNKLEMFTNNLINISFSYPAYWGPVNLNGPRDGQYVLFFSGISSQIVLAAVNPTVEIPGRGGYFGDIGYKIINQEYINDYCTGKDNCNIYTNRNGITIAKHVAFVGTEGGPESDKPTPQYYFYNPNTDYAGFVISPARIKMRDVIDDFENVFESFVDSIKIL